jgi:hypothetical protein
MEQLGNWEISKNIFPVEDKTPANLLVSGD